MIDNPPDWLTALRNDLKVSALGIEWAGEDQLRAALDEDYDKDDV